jgi:hypothetical protein
MGENIIENIIENMIRMKKFPQPRRVQLANGQTGVILIPGLDACLVGLDPDPKNNKLWAITEWDYQRRLAIIEKKRKRKQPAKEIDQDGPLNSQILNLKESTKSQTEFLAESTFRQNPDWEQELKTAPDEEILPRYMTDTRIIKYLH